MRSSFRRLNVPLLVAALAASAGTGACYHHGYDANNHAEHRWNNAEEPYYERWEHETHRDHRDFNQRGGDEQNAYWSWRVTIQG